MEYVLGNEIRYFVVYEHDNPSTNSLLQQGQVYLPPADLTYDIPLDT